MGKVKKKVRDDVLVLRSHNECFRGLHARIDAIKQAQDRAFERLRRSLVDPKRALDVFGALFGRSISEADVHLLGMATGESIACLNHLVLRGEVRRETDANGVDWYRCPGPARSAPAQRMAPAS